MTSIIYRDITEERFVTVYNSYNGCYTHIARVLHISHRTAKKISQQLGLKPHKYLNVTQAARLLNIPRPTLDQWIRQGKFPGVKLTPRRNSPILIEKSAIRLFEYPENPQRAIEPGYISVAQAAKKLNYSIAMTRRMCQQGKIPAKKSAYGIWMIGEGESKPKIEYHKDISIHRQVINYVNLHDVINLKDLGGTDAVRRSIFRLTQIGYIQRIGRGIYKR